MGKLTANAAWAVAGNMFCVGGRILIVVVLTRFFASEQVGQVLYALAVVTPLSFLINMELRSVYVTDSSGQIEAGHCLAVRLISNVIYMTVLLGFCASQWGSDWGVGKSAIVLLAGAIRGVESLADVYLGVFQKKEKMRLWAVSQAIKIVAILLWVLIMSQVAKNVVWMLVGWLLTTLVVMWFYDRRRAGSFGAIVLRLAGCVSGRLLRRGIALGVFVTLAILNQQAGQYFIKHVLGYSAVAYFGVLMLFVNGATAVQNGVNQAVLGRLARYYAASRKDFVLLLGKVLLICWGGMLVGLLVVIFKGGAILGFLYGSEYAEYADLFVIVTAAGCVLLTGMILGDAIVACHRFKSRMLAIGLGLTVNVIVCLLYIGRYGLEAAAWASLAAASVTSLVCGAALIEAIRSKNYNDK